MDYDRTCSFCKSTDVRVDLQNGNLKCLNCGLILEESIIDPTKEWREFADGNSSGSDPRRVGGPRNERLEDGGLSLRVTGGNAFDKIAQHSMRIGGSDNKSLLKGQKLFKQWGHLIGIPNKIIQCAEETFIRVCDSNKSLKGRSVEAVAAATLYIASRICAYPLKPQDLEVYVQVNIKDIKGAYNSIKDIVEHIPPLDPPRYCQNFCKKLKVAEKELGSASVKIAEKIKELRLLDGKNPRTVAAAAIYLAMLLTPNPPIDLKEIANISKIAENTIKNSYKEIYSRRNELVPEWKGRLPLESLH